MKKQPSIFISYTHKDKERVIPLASYLGRLGLKVWMDTKDLVAGQTIIEKVSEAISKSDLYLVCLSPAALSSQWVNHELNTALTLETTQGQPKVLPIMVAKSELPPMLSGRLYVDMTGSLDQAKQKLRQAIETNIEEEAIEQIEKVPMGRQLVISSVRLELQKETAKCYGGLTHDHDKDDVQEDAVDLLKSLRRRANGVLLNFVSASEMDFSSRYPKFPNGDLSERVEDIEGLIIGTICKRAIVEVEVLNPNEERLAKLISSKLESLGVAKVIYSFFLSPPVPDFPQRALERLQEKYVILGWDPEHGTEVELPDDLKLAVRCTEEEITVALETKYRFQFEKRAKEFSVRNFVDWLLEAS